MLKYCQIVHIIECIVAAVCVKLQEQNYFLIFENQSMPLDHNSGSHRQAEVKWANVGAEIGSILASFLKTTYPGMGRCLPVPKNRGRVG